MSGRSRPWVCCLAAVVLVVLGGWRAADTSASTIASHPAGAADAMGDASRLHDRHVVAEPAAAKRAEIERLVALTVAAAVAVLAALGGGVPAVAGAVHGLRDRSLLRSRGPPFAFVSRP